MKSWRKKFGTVVPRQRAKNQKNVTLGQIQWPDNDIIAEKLYISYALKFVQSTDLDSEHLNKSVKVAENFLLDNEYQDMCEFYQEELWDFIESERFGKAPTDSSIIYARLGLLILPRTDNLNRSERIDWIIQFTQILGKDVNSGIKLLQGHFNL